MSIINAKVISYEEVDHPTDCYYEPSVSERMIALVDQVKVMAEDWDQLTTVELLRVMAQHKVVFEVDDKPWVKGDAA